MQIKVMNYGGETEIRVHKWLQTLTNQEQEELAHLDHGSPDDHDLSDVVKDWIEEHNGERGFWAYIRTVS